MTSLAVNAGIIEPGSPDLDQAFQSFTGPILWTQGVHDALVRPAMPRNLLSLRPEARLSMFANSGHSPFYEEPARFGKELAAFASVAIRS